METVALFVLGIVILAFGLVVSIALHELGHLSFAKLFGVKVTQYMVGFGKTLWSRRRGDTEYGLKMLPFGGYIAMIGMFPPARPGQRPREASTGFYNSVAHAPATDGGGALSTRRRRGIYSSIVEDARSASADTVGDGEEARSFYRLHPFKRILVMLAGPVANLVIAFALLAIIVAGIGVPAYAVGTVAECAPTSTSDAVQGCAPGDPPSPAQAAGFRSGDVITSIDGKAIANVDQATAAIQRAAGTALHVRVRNGDETRTLTVTPAPAHGTLIDPDGSIVKKDAEIGAVGITWSQVYVPQPLTGVPTVFADQLGAVTQVFLALPQRMVEVWNAATSTAPRDADSPIGIVGIGRLAGEITSDTGFSVLSRVQFMLSLLVSLNLALFVLNMIPLLPLDGGHILGAVWEWVRRGLARLFRRRDPGPVDMAKLMPVTYVVVIVLGGMTLLLAYADIVKPVSLFGGG